MVYRLCGSVYGEVRGLFRLTVHRGNRGRESGYPGFRGIYG